ncbi:biotin transporter BioY [Prochlorothrix hollandica]|uniref:Biotin transporter n=1 Tax=Prochlorothrix hollandica PCC 9006 = CALU 1027 TaxID=317619 RepID=A0A0M2PXJ7_PROHO|nr:biotin transporter BioY [Prochlorothrix hollandica]KKI99111.1 biotin biosynthesis protein BioY [Prochlorothrix hollandica PCC 9006 = CALU 1027]
MSPTELLWALVGLLLTIGGTLVEASIASPAWVWSQQGIQVYSLHTSFQVGAVLLVSCLGGKNAGVLSQIAYILLGLAWLPVFTSGGGWGYFREPGFGYLLGFVPGAWLCGTLAFRSAPRLETLGLSCLGGLGVIHGVGLVYLGANYALGWLSVETMPVVQAVLDYTLSPLPAQLAIVCAVSLFAYGLRHLLFY